MTLHLKIGDHFPDFILPDQGGRPWELSKITAPKEVDKRYGFKDGYPIVIVFSRGFFCPRDQQQFKSLVVFQEELKVNFANLISISADEPKVSAAFKAGLGANWPFLSDEKRELINKLGILDETEGEYAFRSLPYTFILKPNLEIYKIYNGWYFVGRPTAEELRQDLRSIMREMDYYDYEAFNNDHVKKIRIPQQKWLAENDNGPFLEGIIASFDLRTGNGYIESNDVEKPVFFNFTAIPGEGYRTIKTGAKVKFSLVKTHTGLSSDHVIKLKK